MTSTHPLGERDSWPATGPVYDIAPGVAADITPGEPTFWARFLPASTESAVSAASNNTAPVWY
jgi:hypothetical protein